MIARRLVALGDTSVKNGVQTRSESRGGLLTLLGVWSEGALNFQV